MTVTSWLVPRNAIVTDLPFSDEAPAMARKVLLSCTVSVAPDVREDAALLTSFFAAHAVHHGQPPLTLSVATASQRLTVIIFDALSTWVPFEAIGQCSTGPRGRTIIECLPCNWGMTRQPDGTRKGVWFQMGLSGEPCFWPDTPGVSPAGWTE
jgi:hypothetical protein